jgi:hypothetical protein
LLRKKAQLLTIGVSDRIDMDLLMDIAGTKENYFFVAQFTELMNFMDQLLAKVTLKLHIIV